MSIALTLKNRLILALILAVGGAFAIAVLTTANQPLEELPPAFVRPVSWVAGAAFVAAFVAAVAAWKASRRSFWRWEFPVALLTAGVSAGVAAWIFLLFFNVLFDASPPRARVMQIVHKQIRKSRKGWFSAYQISARDLRDGQLRDVDVERALWKAKSAGDRVTVTTRAGSLGVERVERVE